MSNEGTFVNGRKQGTFRDYFSDGTTVKVERTYDNGCLHGMQRDYYNNGALAKEKEYANDVEHGIERTYDFETGAMTSDRVFRDGKPHGPQMRRMQCNTGEFVERSNYTDGVLHGQFEQTYTKGDKPRCSGTYSNGRKEGLWREHTSEGRLDREVTYSEDEMRTEVRTFFNDGVSVSRVENYYDGRYDGLVQQFYFGGNNPMKSEFDYKANRREGAYKYFNENGTVREEGRYENDEHVLCREYASDGSLKRARQLVSGSWQVLPE